MVIGKNVKSIEDSAFGYSLEVLYCYATIPPSISEESFNYTIDILYVPTGLSEVYKWSNWGTYFRDIIEMN